MLPKSERLTTQDFQKIKPKIFFRGDFFDIGYVSSSIQKFACVISKKKIKTAVNRNKVKRMIFTALKESKPLQINHYIFYIKTKAEGLPYKTIKEEISKAFATLQ